MSSPRRWIRDVACLLVLSSLAGCAGSTPTPIAIAARGTSAPASTPMPPLDASGHVAPDPNPFPEIAWVDEPRIRNQPSLAGAVQADPDAARLVPLSVRDDGWVRVEYQDLASREWRFGWLDPNAARRQVPDERLCPEPSAGQVLSLDVPDALPCFGGADLVLDSVYIDRVDPGAAPAFGGEPAWLASHGTIVATAHPEGDTGLMVVHVAPEARVPQAPRGWFTIRGHFDDPRAASCTRRPMGEPFRLETPEEQVLWCRQQFVITAAEPVPEPTDAR